VLSHYGPAAKHLLLPLLLHLQVSSGRAAAAPLTDLKRCNCHRYDAPAAQQLLLPLPLLLHLQVSSGVAPHLLHPAWVVKRLVYNMQLVDILTSLRSNQHSMGSPLVCLCPSGAS
jgi:hypothetical protein